jgi:hypothetical protein
MVEALFVLHLYCLDASHLAVYCKSLGKKLEVFFYLTTFWGLKYGSRIARLSKPIYQA